MITAAPPGFVRYMTEYPLEVAITSAAILPDQMLDAVNEINRFWNSAILPIPDAEWQAMDPEHMNWWHILKAGDRGVCHDYAVTKLHALTTAARGALSLAFCHRAEDDAKLDHLVLLANFASGVRVLDSLHFDFYPLVDCAYEMISRQTCGNPQQWESF